MIILIDIIIKMLTTKPLKNHSKYHKSVHKFISSKNFNKLTEYTDFDFQLLELPMLLTHAPINIIRYVVENMININIPDKDGLSLCHFLCKTNSYDLIKYLIDEKNLDITISTTNDNWYPIHIACINQSYDTIKLLIDNGANIEVKSNRNIKSIHLACYYGYPEIVKLLIDNGAKIESKSFPMTPLTEIWIHNSFDSDEDACIKSEDEPRDKPIHIACRCGHVDIVKILIDQGVDLNAIGYFRDRPIHIACQRNYLEIVKLLIDNDADLEVMKNGNERPIHIACYLNYPEIVKLLIAKKVNLNCTTCELETPLSYAFLTRASSIIFKMLLDSGVNLEKKYYNGETILYRVCNDEQYCYPESHNESDTYTLAKLLLNAGANVNSLTNYKESPLHTCCYDYDTFEFIKLLVENGADLEQETINGWKPIHIVCTSGSYDVIKYFLSCNVDVTSLINTSYKCLYDFSYRDEVLKGERKLNKKDIICFNPAQIISDRGFGFLKVSDLLDIINTKIETTKHKK